MKKLISGLLAFTLVFSQQYINAETTELSENDQKIISQVSDENYDKIKDETDLTETRYLNLDLTDIDDISILKKAVNLKYLDIKNGSLTDFSVLSEIPSLFSLSIENNPVSDLSFIKNSGIQRLTLKDTKVTEDEKLKYIEAKDYTLPANHFSSLTPLVQGLLDFEVKIKNPDIVSFGEYGVSDTADNGGIVLAKNTGETKYDIIYNGNVIKTGKITVTEPEIFNPPLLDGIIKVKEAEADWIFGENRICIITDDNTLYTFNGKEYEKIDENVKQYESRSSSYGDPLYILHTDGTMTIDKEDVFSDGTKVSSMICSYSEAFVTTQDKSMWHIEYSKGTVQKKLLTENVVMFDRETEIFSSEDGTCYQLTSSGTVRNLGKHSVKQVYAATYRDNYLLDNDGSLWYSDRRGVAKIEKTDTGVTEVGLLISTSSFAWEDVYRKSNGKVFTLPDKKEVTFSEGDTIRTDSSYSYTDSERPVSFYSADYNNIPELFKSERLCSDFTHMFSNSDDSKNVYFSFLNCYASVSEVNKTIDAAKTDGRDYIILFTRTDGSLWEYHIAEGTFTRKDFGSTAEIPEAEYSSADFLNLIRYMNGTDESDSKAYDINGDGIINILDVIKLKEILL